MDNISQRLFDLALLEDIGTGDVTSACLPADLVGKSIVTAKQDLVVSGLEAFAYFMKLVDANIETHSAYSEGALAPKGSQLLHIKGAVRSVLSAERTALNILQRTCGIATLTHTVVQSIKHTTVKILDTRKTAPGMRQLEKAAVRAGGGHNHRFGLFDGILIKDNHIDAIGSIQEAIRRAKATAHHLLRIECEVRTLDEVVEALAAGADVLLLDNMNTEMLREAVKRIAHRAQTEASGGITLQNVREIAETGVDFISMGSLTHSAPSADISLEWQKQ